MWRVVWLQTALNELAAAWTPANSALRQSITTAANVIDQLLASEPYNQGESRAYGQRIMFEPPLGVTFELRAQTRTVRVLHVWIVRQRGTL